MVYFVYSAIHTRLAFSPFKGQTLILRIRCSSSHLSSAKWILYWGILCRARMNFPVCCSLGRSKWTACKSMQGFLGCAAGDWLLGWFGDGSDGGILFLMISSDSLDCWDAGSCSMCWQRWSICLPVLSGLGCRLIHPWFYRTTWMARALARNRCIY